MDDSSILMIFLGVRGGELRHMLLYSNGILIRLE